MAGKRAEAAILIGIPGAGKTTFYVQHLLHTHVRLSLDVAGTRAKLDALVGACLSSGQSFALDNTNVAAADRAPYVARAKAAGFRVVAYFFVPDVRRSIALNSKREPARAVPVYGVLRAFKRLEAPRAGEGFDRTAEVRFGGNGAFEIVEAEMP